MITRMAELGDVAFMLSVLDDDLEVEVHDLALLRDLSEFRRGAVILM